MDRGMSQFLLPDWSETLLKLSIAFVVSAIIGLEREARHRPAGFRTHILVCTASCLLMMISISLGGERFDPARLAAQVVTGMGFLGAGTIIRHGDVVRGLTTAASLWAVAALGLVVGMGWFIGALLGTVFVGGTLIGLNLLEKRIVVQVGRASLQAEIGDEPTRISTLLRDIEAVGAQLVTVEVGEAASGRRLVKADVNCEQADGIAALAERLLRVDGVTEVQCR